MSPTPAEVAVRVDSHVHADGTAHVHDHEPALPTRHDAGQGPVVLDVGGDIGALVLHTTQDLLGAEIEISPADRPERRQHVAVHQRQTPWGSYTAAVYPELSAGTWLLWRSPGVAAMSVDIDGGRVTEATWPTAG